MKAKVLIVDDEADLLELGRLVRTLGYDVDGTVTQRRDNLASAAVLGEGKLKELADRTVMAPIWLASFDPRATPKLFPPAGPARWKALVQEALGDGILDATQPRRREIALPQDDGRKGYIELQQGKVKRALDALEKDADSLGMLTTIGEITIGCALGYLDFRYADEPWRPGHPKLEAWYAKVVKLPPLAETMPVA